VCEIPERVQAGGLPVDENCWAAGVLVRNRAHTDLVAQRVPCTARRRVARAVTCSAGTTPGKGLCAVAVVSISFTPADRAVTDDLWPMRDAFYPDHCSGE
jgi:hypothetical protein